MRVRAFGTDTGHQVQVDVCIECGGAWFDHQEAEVLSDEALLSYLRQVASLAAAEQPEGSGECPRCGLPLRRRALASDGTGLAPLRCLAHGHFNSLGEMLARGRLLEPLRPEQRAQLAQSFAVVKCSACRAPVDLHGNGLCGQCGAPLRVLGGEHLERLVQRLGHASQQEQVRFVDLSAAPVPPSQPRRQGLVDLLKQGLSSLSRILE